MGSSVGRGKSLFKKKPNAKNIARRKEKGKLLEQDLPSTKI